MRLPLDIHARHAQGDGKSFKLNFDDWFYAIDDRACIVRDSAGRAGIPFATAHVTYRKL